VDADRVVIDVPARTVAKAVAVVLVMLGLVRLFEGAAQVITWLAIAAFLAVALEPIVRVLQRWMSRPLAVMAVFAGLLVIVAAFLAVLIVPLATQVDDLQRAAPGYIDKLKHNHTIQDLNQRYDLLKKAQSAATDLPARVFGTLSSVASGVVAAITVLFLTLFLMLEMPSLAAAVLSLMPEQTADRVSRISVEVNRRVGGYVIGNLIISVIAGSVIGVSLFILGVPFAAALAVLMAIFDLVPLVGATIGALAAIGVAFATQGVTAGIVMIAVNVVYQQVENHVLQPLVYRRTVELSSFLILVAVLVGGALLGVLGALVAIPVAGAIQVIARDLLAGRRRPQPSPPAPPEAIDAAQA
jgi:predicted PurR-regulated permease PerM